MILEKRHKKKKKKVLNTQAYETKNQRTWHQKQENNVPSTHEKAGKKPPIIIAYRTKQKNLKKYENTRNTVYQVTNKITHTP